MRLFPYTIPAGGCQNISVTGKVFTLKASSLPVVLTFDNGSERDAQAGAVVNLSPAGFKTICVLNRNAVPVKIVAVIGDVAATFAANDNSVANAQHYAFGNLGVANNGNVPDDSAPNHLTAVAVNGSGYLSIPNAPNLLVSGTNNGHRRQLITFDVSPASAASLNVLDANGLVIFVIPAGQARQIVTDADLKISGAGGVASAAIGQIFLNA